jgi:hypothetical protein
MKVIIKVIRSKGNRKPYLSSSCAYLALPILACRRTREASDRNESVDVWIWINCHT